MTAYFLIYSRARSDFPPTKFGEKNTIHTRVTSNAVTKYRFSLEVQHYTSNPIFE